MVPRSLISRRLAPLLVDALTEARVVAVLGPRQAGKSTIVRTLDPTAFAGRYVTLDDDNALAEALASPSGFLADRGTPLALDEIQRAPDLMLAIKSQVDRDDAPGQYLITGSTNLTSIASIPDALPGRVDYLELWPLTQGEIEGTTEAFIDRLFARQVPAIDGAPIGRSAYAERIVTGGYPESVRRSAASRPRYLAGLLRSTLTGDAASVWRGDVETTRRTAEALSHQSAALLNHASLARRVGVSDHTVRAHVAALEDMYLVRRHRPWLSNVGRRLVKSAKAYVADPGMLCAMLRLDVPTLVGDGAAAGPVFETFVAMELARQAAWDVWGVNLLHYRDEHGHQVDVVIERGDGTIVGVEVKSAASVARSDLRGLDHLRRAAGDRFVAGVVLYTGADTIGFGDDLWAVPLCGLWHDADSVWESDGRQT